MQLLVPPEWISKPENVLKAKEGSNLKIECPARGEPEPTVTISKKQGRTISPVDFARLLLTPNNVSSIEY